MNHTVLSRILHCTIHEMPFQPVVLFLSLQKEPAPSHQLPGSAHQRNFDCQAGHPAG